jgi:DNA-binding NtrC family response regulator
MATILIVDDEPQVRAFLRLTFQLAGYVVRTAGSARDAIAICSAEPFDVVLSDVMDL